MERLTITLIFNTINKMKTIAEFLKAFTTDIDLVNSYNEGMSFSEFNEDIDTVIQQSEIIYYSEAMKYLSENDNSLCESLELASELGYTTENLNSELLATLLYQQYLMNQWQEIYQEIEEYFEEYENYLSELENE